MNTKNEARFDQLVAMIEEHTAKLRRLNQAARNNPDVFPAADLRKSRQRLQATIYKLGRELVAAYEEKE